jgi:uncharacterized protein
MAIINDTIKALFGSQVAIVSTASKNGIPNAVPKGSVMVADDETLIYAEGTGEKTLKNLRENPWASVLIFDRATGDGYQIKGTVELISSGELFQKMTRRQEERKKPAPRLVVKIRSEEIYSIKQGMAGKRIA